MTTMNTEVISERALGCWSRIARESSALELYVKVSERRHLDAIDGVREVHDGGVAVRVFDDGEGPAGFAACLGFSEQSIAWTVATARERRDCASGLTPRGLDRSHRSVDLDPALELPGHETLSAWVARDRLAWIEAGVTTEVLVGPGGWVAQRRRHRVWGRTSEEPARLLARRAGTQWGSSFLPTPATRLEQGNPRLALLPEALAPIVQRLARQCGEKLPTSWKVTDEPAHPDGLVGGRFDDAGFAGGSLQRRSFRDPPEAGFANLVLRSTDNEAVPAVGAVVSRGRVIALAAEDWVVELDLTSGERKHLRVSPDCLAGSFSATFGAARATADGPIVPGVILDTQRLVG